MAKKTTYDKKAILYYAENLYHKKGPTAVYDYANSLGRNVVKWGYCNACHAETPSVDGSCMLCGQDVKIPVTMDEQITVLLNALTKIYEECKNKECTIALLAKNAIEKVKQQK